MTETESNAIPAENQNNKTTHSPFSEEKISDEEFFAVAKNVLERNLGAFKELAK